MKPYLAIHILNRIWSRLLDARDFDAMDCITQIQFSIIEQHILEAQMIELLGDINFWNDFHEVSA